MKTLFAVTVLIAGIYLFIQQSGLEKLKQYLPQNQIEQNAESLLVKVSQNVSATVNKSVDQKIVQLKHEILALKSKKISALEKQLARLEAKHMAKEDSEINTASLQKFETEQTFATAQFVGDKTLTANAIPPHSMDNNLTDTSSIGTSSINNNSEKQKAIKRQANLQDIADRMNKTSLLALTQ